MQFVFPHLSMHVLLGEQSEPHINIRTYIETNLANATNDPLQYGCVQTSACPIAVYFSSF